MMTKDRLIVALDVDNGQEARTLIGRLAGKVGCFKIGSRLFTREGPDLVREIVSSGEQVFLDLKYHDIPSITAAAALAAAQMGVAMLTLHTLGGAEMLEATVRGVGYWRESTERARPWLIGVTILTSMDSAALTRSGVDRPLDEMVLRLAAMAVTSGLDGIVTSPRELERLRMQGPPSLKIITPGVRPEWADRGDQTRVLTPYEAMRRGADYLVIGRPIICAVDPLAAVERILEEMEGAHDQRNQPLPTESR
ncbi:MAG: orotidine-5'-phosphate decarboxylase [Acidobacteria bacterium]|nr:orotidine-5'-phosphate decarboxylase [Acidobacteriota bacterium]MBI3656105.1 orotidine-5'-phosphate decarboxylase [Acidobacteriota bacterium]